jgi:hypothetical protein
LATLSGRDRPAEKNPTLRSGLDAKPTFSDYRDCTQFHRHLSRRTGHLAGAALLAGPAPYRLRRCASRERPGAFADRIGLSAHQKAADYTIAKTRFGIIEMLLETGVLVALTFGGALDSLVSWTGSLPVAPLVQDLTLIVSVVLITGVIALPFSYWQTFVIEAKFGFNRMTLKLWIADLIKGVLLGAALGIPLTALALWLMRAAGPLWWLWVWLVWIGFQFLVLALYPDRHCTAVQQVLAAAARARRVNGSRRCSPAAALPIAGST